MTYNNPNTVIRNRRGLARLFINTPPYLAVCKETLKAQGNPFWACYTSRELMGMVKVNQSNGRLWTDYASYDPKDQ